MLRAPPPSVPGMVRVGFVGSGLIAWAHGLGLKAMIDGGVVDASIVAVHDTTSAAPDDSPMPSVAATSRWWPTRRRCSAL